MRSDAYRRADLPPRTDLHSRRRRAVVAAATWGVEVSERLRERFLAPVMPPQEDPFLRAPVEPPPSPPGTVLDSRPVEVRMLRRPFDADAWQVRFATTGVGGAPSTGVATVMVPRRASPGTVRPLLSYQCAIDALGPGSDPSYTLPRGDQMEVPLIGLALRRGWAVVVTDYNGPEHAFCAFPMVARYVLDGIRAAVGFEPAGLAASPVGLWGYSGGALATLFAMEAQAAYAPELRIVGAAAGGAGVDIVASPEMFEAANMLSGIPFCAVIGVARGFPDVDLASVLTPQGRALVEAARDMTLEQLVASFAFIRWSDHLTVDSVFDIPGMPAALEAGSLGSSVPVAPLHLYHAVRDRYPDVADVDRLVEQYRAAGLEVAYRRYGLGGHLTAALAGVPGALRFLAGRFGG